MKSTGGNHFNLNIKRYNISVESFLITSMALLFLGPKQLNIKELLLILDCNLTIIRYPCTCQQEYGFYYKQIEKISVN